MECINVMEMIDAWVDHELPDNLASQISLHVEQCQSCRHEADALRQLSKALNTIPPVNEPARLIKNTLNVFRSAYNNPGFLEWWQNLGFSMRSFVCGMAMAGLLFGFILGVNINSYKTDASANTYLASLYPVEGILP